MREDVFAAINRCYNSLTRMERIVADYVLANSSDVLYMSISELAQSCGACESTISRFCGRLGTPGYRGFRTALAMTVRSREHDDEAMAADSGDESARDTHIRLVYNDYLSRLRETHQMLDAAKLEEVAIRLVRSERIMFSGVGETLGTVLNAYQRFLRISPKVCFSQDVRSQIVLVQALSHEDAVIFFTAHEETPELLSIAKTARENHTCVIVLSRYAESDLSTYADYVFLSSSRHSEGNGAYCSAAHAQAFVADILRSLFIEHLPQRLREKML